MEDDALAARAARLGCATLVDAVGRVHGHRAHIPAMSSPDPLRPLFGPAATISYLPFRDDLAGTVRDFKHYFYGALEQEPAVGQVLVLSSGGHPEVSHGGGTKLARADGAGLAGVLADGRLRDFDQLRGYSFATWCTGEAVRWGGDTVMPFAYGVAVEVCGVCVKPGDYVHMDSAGGVVIPSASLHRVFAIAEDIAAEEAEAAGDIRSENAQPGG
ncbi:MULTISPECIES: RraA family protein [Streptomyces]|uniref:Putative 4-hydroxy-4-methyl-2-oxoglutarate aldolase n=1 Tax=Streptomyces spinosisporus TaxID=2927582 RepID=A0ABS9XWR5_9ACTN|nr:MULTISPECIES: RraA family protein [Streptomyces]MCI3246523.1 RraA family protein [Streptomyces spinosisporus]WUB41111.1 RraA family protein [Streptomyces sp. NBC_00588]